MTTRQPSIRVVLIAVVLAGALSSCGHQPTSSAPRPTSSPSPRVFTSASPAGVRAPPVADASPRARTAAATARAFTAAFGVYETGRLTASALAHLKATASRELVDQLVAQPVRGARARPVRPTRVLFSSTGQLSGQLAATVLRNDGSSLDLQLARPTGRWTVMECTAGQLGSRN